MLSAPQLGIVNGASSSVFESSNSWARSRSVTVAAALAARAHAAGPAECRAPHGLCPGAAFDRYRPLALTDGDVEGERVR